MYGISASAAMLATLSAIIRACPSPSITHGPAMRNNGLLPPRRSEPSEISLDSGMDIKEDSIPDSTPLCRCGGEMRPRIATLVLLAIVVSLYAVRARDSGTVEAERYIIDSERQWAESVATGDPSAVERILADDMVGVDPDGSFYDKAKMGKGTREASGYFISNHLSDVKVRFYGDAAVAQG